MLCALVLQESDAIDRLVKCLAEDTTQSTHRYMARRLREALEKKRQQPECECPRMYWKPECECPGMYWKPKVQVYIYC